jgi:hypothetical protein
MKMAYEKKELFDVKQSTRWYIFAEQLGDDAAENLADQECQREGKIYNSQWVTTLIRRRLCISIVNCCEDERRGVTGLVRREEV